MATYFMFGDYSLGVMDDISATRTKDAITLIEEHGGKLISGYALLGQHDLVLIVEFPGVEEVMRASVNLSEMLGIAFTTAQALTVEAFDKLFVGE